MPIPALFTRGTFWGWVAVLFGVCLAAMLLTGIVVPLIMAVGLFVTGTVPNISGYTFVITYGVIVIGIVCLLERGRQGVPPHFG